MPKIDENYEGSIFEKLGFDRVLCDDCGAHLMNGRCLNACGLTVGAFRRFQVLLQEAEARPAPPPPAAADGAAAGDGEGA